MNKKDFDPLIILRKSTKWNEDILNPYWQILENSSRNFSKIFIFWVVTQAVLLENSSSFFSKFKFWGVTQAVLLENSSIKNHGYLFSFVQFWGVTQAVLLENSSIKNHGHLFSFFNSGASHRPFYWKTHPFEFWIYNSPGHNSVLFITNSNSAVGKSDSIFTDRRKFLGGHYSRSLPESNSRLYSAKIYNDNMGGVDNYDIYLHKYTLRYIPLKHKLAWLLKPVLSVIDYHW